MHRSSRAYEPGQQCEQRDVVILRSMPGLGRIILAVLLAEVWQPLRRRDYHALRSLSGVAPVTRRSGKTSVVVRRYACNKRLANALYHWARLATQHDALSRRRYAALRQRGHSHGRALRTVADRLLSVACTLLEQQTLFAVARRSGWERSGNQDRNPVSRHWHDCRGVIVAQAELRFWMSRRGDQALAVIVAWIGGRPRLRLRSSAARRR